MDTLIAFGSAVKNLGDGKIGGHLVLFSDVKSPDLTGDYFDAKTDFDFDDGDARTGYYNHGLDIKIGNTKIGKAKLSVDDVGVWLEGQITLRGEYADAVMKLVDAGELGLSSGALSHLVRREKATKSVNYVTHWPLGEWSLTPTPAEPRTQVQSIKSYIAGKALVMDEGQTSGYDYDTGQARPANTQTSIVQRSVSALSDTLNRHIGTTLAACDKAGHTAAKGMPKGCCADCLKSIMDGIDEHAEVARAIVPPILGQTPKAKKSIDTVSDLERFLREAGHYSRSEAKSLIHTLKSLLREAGAPIEQPVTPIETERDPAPDDTRWREINLLARLLEV